MKTYIGIGEVPAYVTCGFDNGNPYIKEVLIEITVLDGLKIEGKINIAPLLSQDVLDDLVKNWLLCYEAETREVCF